MSRAFVNEDAGADRPDLPELPLSTRPNYVTPRGLADLQARLATRVADLAALKARAERLDKLPEAAAERDIRWLEARLKSAILVDPAAQSLQEVAFGLRVTVCDEEGRESSYEITGEDEADANLGRIAPHSPLARALLGAQVGDEVVWKRPAGDLTLEVVAISLP
ncbi:GreA/GreB family elongation factor [Xinfangfangia sp. CPCC 101601]|uniref:GreA/GreB family elongation factor n=1 Tax=Pseudogemmobacter lacusdianii TaxID=3069608 RepID=A0ABU0W0F7_9RHOB|nr:GreA/GreB family elongation factor [Xinfangfangia sp. CPCC 101601]MDQ2067373.1 GreA/GreB family elongation factor [Xinfangfangia sp. CPCC 101601]